MANDSAVLLLDAGQKSGDVFEGDQWDVEAIAEPDEPGGFDRSVNVQNSRKVCRLIRNDANRPAANARIPRRCSWRSVRGLQTDNHRQPL